MIRTSAHTDGHGKSSGKLGRISLQRSPYGGKMSSPERRSGSSCWMNSSCPPLFSIHSLLIIQSQRHEKAMKNGGDIFSSQRQAATRSKRPGREVNGVSPLPPVVSSRLIDLNQARFVRRNDAYFQEHITRHKASALPSIRGRS